MTIIWQACAGHEWCVHIPFDGNKCLSAQACVRVLEEDSNFFIEVEVLGARERIPLGNACLEARYYVFAAKACVANLNVQPHLLQFDIVLRLCIDASIGPIHIGECVDIYKQHVSIGFLAASDLEALEMPHPVRHHQAGQTPVRVPAFAELVLEPSHEAQVKSMF